MARTSRNNMRNSSFFHIMVQGINKEYIFKEKKDSEKYLKLLYKNIDNIQVMAYCIMNNHAHILINTKQIESITTWMKKCNTSYAFYYNKKYNRVGYVFRNRYQLQPIKDAKHLYLCMDYIHDNPIKAGICDKREKYEFSSYSKIYNSKQENVKMILKNLIEKNILEKENESSIINEKIFLDESIEKNEICTKKIQEFLEDKKISLESLRKDKKFLSEIVKILKNYGISYRIMENEMKIGRETLRNLFKNSQII